MINLVKLIFVLAVIGACLWFGSLTAPEEGAAPPQPAPEIPADVILGAGVIIVLAIVLVLAYRWAMKPAPVPVAAPLRLTRQEQPPTGLYFGGMNAQLDNDGAPLTQPATTSAPEQAAASGSFLPPAYLASALLNRPSSAPASAPVETPAHPAGSNGGWLDLERTTAPGNGQSNRPWANGAELDLGRK